MLFAAVAPSKCRVTVSLQFLRAGVCLSLHAHKTTRGLLAPSNPWRLNDLNIYLQLLIICTIEVRSTRAGPAFRW